VSRESGVFGHSLPRQLALRVGALGMRDTRICRGALIRFCRWSC
jgi:hypothetical protein